MPAKPPTEGYTESAATGWFVGIIATLALLAIAYLVFSANSQPAPITHTPSESVVLVDMGKDNHGSGVYIGGGFVLTAAHVSNGKETLDVVTQDNQRVTARVLWGSLNQGGSDVALLYAPDLNLPAAKLTCTDAAVGDEITAFGNPWDVKFAETWGRVSSRGATGIETELGKFAWNDLSTIDITIAPGVSGGPVFNSKNEVVGISVAVLITSRGNFPYAFMVPSSAVCRMLGRTS